MSESTAPTAWWANPSERALDCAQDYLERLGYRVLARQFRDCDLIAGRWPLVIACEVRARRIVEPVDDDRSVRRKRLRVSASIWLANPRNRGFHEVRFDRIDRDLPQDVHSFHRLGWDYALPRLAAVAAGQDPGPDPLRSPLRLAHMTTRSLPLRYLYRLARRRLRRK